MGHPEIDNKTPFAFQPFFSTDEEAHPLFVPIIKATYTFDDKGRLAVAEKQTPVNLAGEFWGDPDSSSYKYEPECAFIKPATDVVLIGHAYARAKEETETEVALRVGPMGKTIRVTGDRYWIKALGAISMSRPAEFERIPLTYERAFGGWDRTNADPDRHAFEARNPVGTGFRAPDGLFEQGVRLPNLEDPQYPLKNYGDVIPPAGFGFTSPHWQPRAALAGTYDEVWNRQRMPLLPKDFNRQYFNGASAGLIAPGYLRGNEPVMVRNASKAGTLSFNLPGVEPPVCRVQVRGRVDHIVETRLDTVIINTDDSVLLLIWRGRLAVRSGPQDVVAVEITVNGVPNPAAVL